MYSQEELLKINLLLKAQKAFIILYFPSKDLIWGKESITTLLPQWKAETIPSQGMSFFALLPNEIQMETWLRIRELKSGYNKCIRTSYHFLNGPDEIKITQKFTKSPNSEEIFIYTKQESRTRNMRLTVNLATEILRHLPLYIGIKQAFRSQEYLFMNDPMRTLLNNENKLIDLNQKVPGLQDSIEYQVKKEDEKILQSSSPLYFIRFLTNNEGIRKGYQYTKQMIRLNEINSYLLTIAKDLSRPILIEESYTHAFKRFSHLMIQSEYYPWVLRKDNRQIIFDQHVQLNPYIKELITLTAMHIQNILTRIHPDDRKVLSLHLQRIRQKETANRKFQMELRIRLSDNAYKWFSIHAICSDTTTGSFYPIRMSGILHCIHKQKETEMILQNYVEALQSQESQKTCFLSHMHHELRTPLNLINGFSELSSLNPREYPEFGFAIQQASRQILNHVNNILEYTSLNRREDLLYPEDVDLWELIEDIRQKESKYLSGSVRLLFVTPYEKRIILAEKQLLRSAISKLVNNAINNTTHGYIIIKYMVQTDSVLISISDTGCGISSEDQKKLFIPYGKINSFKPGTGLGLAICKLMADRTDSMLNVNSKPGVGTTFTLLLKQVIPHSDPSCLPLATSERTLPEKKGKKICIFNYKRFPVPLKEIEFTPYFQISWFHDPALLFQTLKKNKTDLFVLDVQISSSAAKKILNKVSEIRPELPVIICSHFDLSDISEGRKGVYFMMKPFHPLFLKEKIIEVLDEK